MDTGKPYKKSYEASCVPLCSLVASSRLEMVDKTISQKNETKAMKGMRHLCVHTGLERG